jgi:hypothetical protein
MENTEHTALYWLGHLHYQICNGGIAQACYNGYVDDVIEAYGSFDDWVAALKTEIGNSDDASRKALDAARLIVGQLRTACRAAMNLVQPGEHFIHVDIKQEKCTMETFVMENGTCQAKK